MEMVKAYSVPLGVFVLFPMLVLIMLSGLDLEFTLGIAQIFVALALPCFFVGFILAPWAGRNVERSFFPAGVMSATSALASVVTLSLLPLIFGGIVLWPGVALKMIFAVPIALFAAVLFIGRSQARLSEQQESRSFESMRN